MVKPKDEGPKFPSPAWFEKQAEDFERDHPVVDTRYYVVEITPSTREAIYNGDGHGGTTYEWTGVSEKRVSNYCANKKVAQEWMDKHEPDEGKTLTVREDKLRVFTEKRWM